MNTTKPRFIITTFESITEDSAGGIGNLSYALSKFLFTHNYDVVFYTINKGPNQTDFESRSVHRTSRYFLFLLNFFFRFKFFNGTSKRKIEEWYYDYFLARQNLNGDYLITTHAFIPKTLKRHSKKFKSVSYIPPTPNEEVIFRICKEELAKVKDGESYHDAYTDKDRLTNFKNALPYISKVISISPITSKSFQGAGIRVIEFPFINKPKKYSNSQELQIKRNHKIIFLYIAYSVLLKGLHRLLEERRLADLTNAELHIVGPIDKQYEKIFKIDFLKFKNVKYHGYTSNTKPFYQDADVVVIPSLIDGEPHIAIEALNFKKPVLISNGCGHANFIGNSVPEAVFNINSSGLLADKLKIAAKDIESFSSKYEQLFDFVESEKFNYDLFYQNIIDATKE